MKWSNYYLIPLTALALIAAWFAVRPIPPAAYDWPQMQLGGAGTVGYTSQGASEYAAAVGDKSNPAGLKVTLPVDGTFASASFYGRRSFADKTTRVSIYSDVAGERGSLLHSTQNGTIIFAGPALWTMNFASPPTLTAGTYWLQVTIDSAGAGNGNGWINYDTGGGASTSYTLDDAGVPTYSTIKYSVYASYTFTDPVTTTGGQIKVQAGSVRIETGSVIIKPN